MPTYEYECEKCKKTFDLFQSMKDAPLKSCPQEQCRMKRWGKGKVRRLLGAGAGLLFKGSGFYITDYRGSGYAEAAKKDSANHQPAGNAAATNPSSASETKSAAANREVGEKKSAANSEKKPTSQKSKPSNPPKK